MKKSLGAKTLAEPAPAWVIGSYDAQGKPNIMTIAWGGICCFGERDGLCRYCFRKNGG
jgi:flavin reductase (DIM6/NTAB) family NADH-FMN oxidoreductase RutF